LLNNEEDVDGVTETKRSNEVGPSFEKGNADEVFH